MSWVDAKTSDLLMEGRTGVVLVRAELSQIIDQLELMGDGEEASISMETLDSWWSALTDANARIREAEFRTLDKERGERCATS